MKALLKYDLFFLQRTKKFVVFIAIFVFFSILSPLTAKYLSNILEYLLGEDGLALPIPEPTTLSAYAQYVSDLMETILFVVLFGSISIFIHDKSKGLQPLIFTKPINRTKYILSKYLSFTILLVVSTLIGYLFFTYYVYVLFDEVWFVRGLAAMGLYVLYLSFLTSIGLLFSTLFKSYWGASLLTFGIYLFFTILTIFGEFSFFQYLPGMMTQQIINVLMEVETTKGVVLTSGITLGITIVMIVLSIIQIRKQDI